MGLAQAQAATQRIEEGIRAAVPHIERVLIRTEPAVPTHIRYAIPLSDRTGAVSPPNKNNAMEKEPENLCCLCRSFITFSQGVN